MSISMKVIVSIGAAVMAVLVESVAAEVRSNDYTRLPPPTEGVFKRCDGRKDPVEAIKISSCPDAERVGHCDINSLTRPTMEMSFTPDRDYEGPYFHFGVQGPSDTAMGYDPCQHGVECPLKKGKQETMVFQFVYGSFKVGEGLVRFQIEDDIKGDVIYCVQFPAKITAVAVSDEAQEALAQQEVFKRCDGRKDPVGAIKISSCPDAERVGHCDINSLTRPTMEMSFTPDRDYEGPYFHFGVQGPSDTAMGYDPCQSGVECPLKKGKQETMVFQFMYGSFKVGEGLVRFQIKDEIKGDVIYCVQFPARITK